MSAIGAIVTSVVGLVGLALYQSLVDQSRARREARAKKRKPGRPRLRVLQGGKA